ncbi:hypothetical protein [Clostridium thermarum]|uniref:hypothetical protein n=1 Tax=Clostridium thermarum TaxID=1716543 RepID=UPI001123F0E3|nr:hypothetical protein [Clostridium thermarum]
MYNFRDFAPTNGFDSEDLTNARQNNYAWSMSDLGDYIYVGTGRNILYNIIRAIQPQAQIPDLIDPGIVDNLAEIWRRKKSAYLPWEKVYKAPVDSGITGFRYMIRHNPLGGRTALYAAAFAPRVQILKSTNGINWFILPDTVLQGTSSRAMVVHNGKLYVATLDEANPSPTPLLYSSEDPEFYPWQLVTDYSSPDYDPARNPVGFITNMAVFNNRLYVATSTDQGAQVWRTNGTEPRLNDWTLIADRGFGNPANVYTLAMGVFRNYLYVSATKELPLSWAIPQGCDIIRIDKSDRWDLVVGGNPLIAFLNPDAENQRSLSGLGSGFNNPFNVYAWQIQEYQDKLLISTFDDSSNMEVILTTLLANRAELNNIIGETTTNLLIGIYRAVILILRAIRYPFGFDLYVSDDGIHFDTIFLNGLCNPNNYGARILYVDTYNDLYLGTANPFQGCEVWRTDCIGDCPTRPCRGNHYASLWRAKQIITDYYKLLSDNLPVIQQFLPKDLIPCHAL